MKPAILGLSTIDNTVISVSNKTTFGGVFTSIYGFLSNADTAVFLGVIIGVVGLIINVIFQYRKDRREEKIYLEHKQREDEAHEWARKESKSDCTLGGYPALGGQNGKVTEK